MEFLIGGLFWILGIIIGSFGIVQMLIILFFSIRFTRFLDNKGLLTNKSAINKGNLITIVVWLIITGVSSWLVYKYASSLSVTFYFIGIAFTFFAGIKKLGANSDNMEDYFNSYHRFINVENLKNADDSIKQVILFHLSRIYGIKMNEESK